ncbi:RNI-like protein [Myriangium duriaei CBS 260.36]|uniref:RNI-like protein n=1 Tax=Myriangium duriaei CBS 260.36 TaxID=1168546 RepID=A0A9P4J4A2_9PEZI|nr:RNI-like protein [Myriangium duriaei CBS 260.36]
MSRPGRLQRRHSASSSSSTSPERGADDDNDSFTMQPNDSQSSLALSLSETDMMTESLGEEEEHLRRCRQIPVYRLPAEILISIFSRLSSTRDLQSCMLVSKEWAKNSVGLLWHRPSMNNWNSVHSVLKSIRKVDKMFAYQDLVKRLNMSTLGSQISDGVLLGMTACKRIERLTLTTCTKLSDFSLVPLIHGNRSLVALDVTGMEFFTDKSLLTVADNCVRLQGLNVTGCRRLTDESVMAVARNCRHLKRLKFNACTQLTDKSIMTVAAHSSHLLEIDLFDLPFVESPSVTHLLTSCKQLRELRLMRCPRITDSAFTSLPLKAAPFEALRILDLTDCTETGDKAVEKIVATCPRLRNLLLAKCRHLTDRAVYAITKLGKNLHYLHLGHCARLTDESIKVLSRHCTRIRYIDLACCSNLTDASITQLAANLPKLKRVGLVKCAGITDRSIHALATYGGRTGHGSSRGNAPVNVLERVHLSYCTQLTIEGIHTLLNNCPRLTHLSLTGVQAFLREDLTVFCREAPPEFNDHQRDVFCVFSGPGVSRLREHLNKIDHYLTPGSEPDGFDEGQIPRPPVPMHRHLPPRLPPLPNLAQGGDIMDDEDLDDDGEATPDHGDEGGDDRETVIQVPVHSTPTINNSRPLDPPTAADLNRFHMPDAATLVPTHYIPPPPAAQRVPGFVESVWAAATLDNLPIAPYFRPAPRTVSDGSEQQMTGMMGAAILDDERMDVQAEEEEGGVELS